MWPAGATIKCLCCSWNNQPVMFSSNSLFKLCEYVFIQLILISIITATDHSFLHGAVRPSALVELAAEHLSDMAVEMLWVRSWSVTHYIMRLFPCSRPLRFGAPDLCFSPVEPTHTADWNPLWDTSVLTGLLDCLWALGSEFEQLVSQHGDKHCRAITV